MQAPHSESSQPSLAPVRPSSLADGESRLGAGLDLDRVGDAVDAEGGGVLHRMPSDGAMERRAGGDADVVARGRARGRPSIARRAITAAIARR